MQKVKKENTSKHEDYKEGYKNTSTKIKVYNKIQNGTRNMKNKMCAKL